MAKLIIQSLPASQFNLPVRLHVSGDFFSQMYFDAWMIVAKTFSKRIFYGYTKSLLYWIKRRFEIPRNMILVASRGGKWDHLIEKYRLRYAVVVYSEAEAEKLGLRIDHDDSCVYNYNKNFALLIHGTQPAGSKASRSWTELKKIGKGGYHNHKSGLIGNSKNHTNNPFVFNVGGNIPLRNTKIAKKSLVDIFRNNVTLIP
jgi:hypothetical protein